jgi:ParB family chromosome partitioning protein
MSRLRDKAAAIDFEGLDAEAPVQGGASTAAEAHAPVAPQPRASSRAARFPLSAVSAMSKSIAVEHEVADLRAKVQAFEAGERVVLLDPAKVRPSKWKNRHELAYQTRSFLDLKDEIAAAGVNAQPIKVRPIPPAAGAAPEAQEYELVFGRRRHRACLELGLQVAAIIDSLSDIDSFKAMVRENRNREDLSPWEAGEMYRDALERGLFASRRQLAMALEIDPGNLTRMLQLAMLPPEVISAFPSPLDLQFRWAQPLDEAVAKDPGGVVARAKELAGMDPRPSAKDVFEALSAVGAPAEAQGAKEEVREFLVGEKVVGVWRRDGKGNASLKLKAGVLTPAKEKKLGEFLSRLLE